MKCQCSWVSKESKGEPTPDDNDAIGMAICYDPLSFGEKGSHPFLICEKHAEKRGKYWKLIPLPGKRLEESHILVQKDDANFPKLPNDVVVEAIKKAFPNHTQDYTSNLLHEVKWDHLNGCYYFNRWGMCVGIERDVHIHS